MLLQNLQADPAFRPEMVWLSREAADSAHQLLRQTPDFAATPLQDLPGLAKALGVASLSLKDESQRLGLGSFKALGGAHAVLRLALDKAESAAGRKLALADLRKPEHAALLSQMTVACASAGNHGRSVAFGARLAGIACKVFVHRSVSPRRRGMIEAQGAEIVAFDGCYDDSVAECARLCEERGWCLVSDTSAQGSEEAPALVMQGYTVLAQEIAAQMRMPPTHLFLQAGVGGMAAAVAAHLALLWGAERPKIIIVEPASAACCLESARAGRAIRIREGAPTLLTMLECYEPSPLAWRVLAPLADHFLAIEDDDAHEMRTRLAAPYSGDPVILAGLSGCAGLAGLSSLARDPDARARLGLGRQSHVLAIVSEGPNDISHNPEALFSAGHVDCAGLPANVCACEGGGS